MRAVLLSMVICLGGCLATQPDHNPLKKGKKQKEAVVAPTAPEKPKSSEPGVPSEPGMTRVELMQEMFLMQTELSAQILKSAEDLTPDELQEFNEFLAPFGRELRPKVCTNPNHDHSKPGHKSRVF